MKLLMVKVNDENLKLDEHNVLVPTDPEANYDVVSVDIDCVHPECAFVDKHDLKCVKTGALLIMPNEYNQRGFSRFAVDLFMYQDKFWVKAKEFVDDTRSF